MRVFCQVGFLKKGRKDLNPVGGRCFKPACILSTEVAGMNSLSWGEKNR